MISQLIGSGKFQLDDGREVTILLNRHGDVVWINTQIEGEEYKYCEVILKPDQTMTVIGNGNFEPDGY